MRTTASFFLLLSLSLSCSTEKDKYAQLEGEWSNVSLYVQQKTVNNTEHDSILIVNEGQWDSLLQMKPIRTTYYNNGTYISRYYNLADSLLFESEGKWHFIGDSLYLSTDEGSTAYYFSVLPNNRAGFAAVLDWDNDGYSDDFYDGVQQKR